jgi:hypothetical protein
MIVARMRYKSRKVLNVDNPSSKDYENVNKPGSHELISHQKKEICHLFLLCCVALKKIIIALRIFVILYNGPLICITYLTSIKRHLFNITLYTTKPLLDTLVIFTIT